MPSLTNRLASLAVAAAVLVASAPANSATKERRFTSAKFGVTVEAPTGWAMSLHTGYPNIIAVLLHPTGSRLSVAISQTAARSAQELLEQNRRGLEAQGLTVGAANIASAGGLIVDAQARTRDEVVRQYYLVREGTPAWQALVVTLTTRKDLLASVSAALDFVVAHLALASPQADGAQKSAPPRLPDSKGGSPPPEQPAARPR